VLIIMMDPPLPHYERSELAASTYC